MKILTLLMTCGLVLGLVLPAMGQKQFQGLCNRVKIEIEQELTTERIGFEAVLKVTNNDGEDPINKFSAALTFKDVLTGEDASNRFFVQPPEFSSINRIDGNGVIGPTKTAIVTWFIIPKTGENAPGGEDPRGKEYNDGCDLSGFIRDEKIPEDVLFAAEDTITVRPEPQLVINYFQPRDVQGDDPFTPEVESPIPFTLGVLVKNDGFGLAKRVKIDSKQPKIVENKGGLLLIARLLGARVQDSPLDETSLLVDLGDINPQNVRKGAWDMITSLSGEFVEFKATYRHDDALGGEETSVIKSLDAHFIAREALNDEPGRDSIMDFLADVDRDSDRIPDTLYETDGAVLPVNYQPQAEVGDLSSGRTTVTLAADREGWVYMRLNDPGQSAYPIVSVVRNDGKVLNPRNYWTNIRYRPADNFKLTYLNLFDRVESGADYTYEVTYQTTNNDFDAPITRLRFSGESSGNDPYYITAQTQLYFTSEDASPVSIEYQVDGDGFRPAIPFRLSQPGTYEVEFFATDVPGNVETTKSVTLIIPGPGSLVELSADESSIFPTDLLSIRPGETPIRANVPPNPLAVQGELIIYKDVLAWPRLSGLPVNPTPLGTAEIMVTGQFVDFYRYRINGGAWSSERAVADPLSLAGLSGVVNLDVNARSSLGSYLPDDKVLQVSWTVDPAAENLSVSGVPATPSGDAENVTLNFSTAGSSTEYRWSDGNINFFHAAAPYSADVVLERQTEGPKIIRVITNAGGSFPDEGSPDPLARVTWNFDRSWGYDFTTQSAVRTIDLGEVAGQGLEIGWDGKDDAGVAQIPGSYTAYLQLTDSLGNVTRASTVIEIEGFSGDRTVVATTEVGPKNLRSKGNWSVWQQKDGSVANIHAFDLTDGTSKAVTTSSEFDQEDPSTDGTYLVWQSRLSNGSTDLFYSELATISAVPATATPTEVEANPVIEWPWIVYQVKTAASPSAPWQIEAFNAETDERFLVSPGVGDQFRPQIHGGRIVWEDHRDVGPGEIYFADLETREVQRITNNTFGQNNPTIHGDTIAWQDNRAGQVDIWIRDLRRSIAEQITATTYNETNPQLDGNWLLFSQDSLGSGTENIELYDLQAGNQIALTRATRKHLLGGLGHGFGSWIEVAEGKRTLIVSRLPGLQAVMTSSNALVVSAGLVNRYGSAFDLLRGWGGGSGVQKVSLYQSIEPLVVKSAEYGGGNPTGDDFALTAGSFLWVEFSGANLIDLGNSETDSIDLAAGMNMLSYTGFPVGYSAYDFVSSLGATKVRGLRLYDAFSGLWRAVELDEAGLPTGPNFTIPRSAMVLVEMREAVSDIDPKLN